jgi:anthranilate phosphoribosyltransferase
LSTDVPKSKLLDVSGTGGDKIKTFNVSTAAAFVIAAGGGYVAKQSTRGYTGATGSADVLQAIGVDPFQISATDAVRLLEVCHVSTFYTPILGGDFTNRIDFLTKLREIGLTYTTPWHLVSWVYSPFDLGARLYGVFSERYIDALAELYANLGYTRALVVHGADGLDELSVVGDTVVREIKGKEIVERRITPEELGINRASVAAISTPASASADQNITDFLRILYGLEHGAKRDLVAVNAGAALYLIDEAPRLAAGTRLALDLIAQGEAARALERFVKEAGTERGRLREWKSRLGLH